ncbi:MAG TPA: hypothetical protein VFZ28_09620, partial [Burkholderiaceae bacterium]|nr:hypothetical protein [Burkholderiaceae bacterium]
ASAPSPTTATGTTSPVAMAVALAVLGAGMLAFVVWRVPETARTRNPKAMHARALFAQIGRTLAHPGSNSLVYVAGTFVCRRLLARYGLVGTVQRGRRSAPWLA